jgi:hypothetical protein
MFISVGVGNVFIYAPFFELHLRFVNHYNKKRDKADEEGMSWEKSETLRVFRTENFHEFLQR